MTKVQKSLKTNSAVCTSFYVNIILLVDTYEYTAVRLRRTRVYTDTGTAPPYWCTQRHCDMLFFQGDIHSTLNMEIEQRVVSNFDKK